MSFDSISMAWLSPTGKGSTHVSNHVSWQHLGFWEWIVTPGIKSYFNKKYKWKIINLHARTHQESVMFSSRCTVRHPAFALTRLIVFYSIHHAAVKMLRDRAWHAGCNWVCFSDLNSGSSLGSIASQFKCFVVRRKPSWNATGAIGFSNRGEKNSLSIPTLISLLYDKDDGVSSAS